MQWIEFILNVASSGSPQPSLGYISRSHLAEIQTREGVEGSDEELSRGVRVPHILNRLERKHLWRQE